MKPYASIVLGASALLCLGVADPVPATAQSAKDLVGTWAVVSVDNVSPDGRRTPAFGANPRGVVMFDGSGRYVELILRADLPKFASPNRMQGTPDENKAVAQGTLAFYGAYSVTGKVVTLTVDGSSYPNWTGGDQVRTVASFNGDEITWTNAAGSGGGVAELVAKRVK
jgi:Lipocalin-like domain